MALIKRVPDWSSEYPLLAAWQTLEGRRSLFPRQMAVRQERDPARTPARFSPLL